MIMHNKILVSIINNYIINPRYAYVYTHQRIMAVILYNYVVMPTVDVGVDVFLCLLCSIL